MNRNVTVAGFGFVIRFYFDKEKILKAADYETIVNEINKYLLPKAEADKASEYLRKQAAAEAEKKMLLEKLTKPSGVSDEEALRRVANIIERAVTNGLTEVQVYRFPNSLCTDHGRAINQQE